MKILRKHFNVSIIIIVVAASLLLGCSRNITLPNVEDVVKIEMGTLTITNAGDIETIMSVLSTANIISRNAMNEQPFVPDLLNIYPYIMINGEEVMCCRLYLFTNGDTESIWNSYVGIYRISQENSDKLRQLYAEWNLFARESYFSKVFE